MNFEKDLQIDKYGLDDEFLRQPSLYNEWSKLKARAEQERDKIKEQLDLIKAELDIAIRKDPKAFGMEKLTESAISNIILVQDKFQKAEMAYLDARYNFNVISGAVEALNHKKSALENLVKLFLNNYWAEGKVSKEAEELAEKAATKMELRSLDRSERLRSRQKPNVSVPPPSAGEKERKQ